MGTEGGLMLPRKARMLLAAGAIPLLLAAYVRLAPFEAPETKGPVPGTVVLDAHGTVLERDGREGFRIPVALDAIAPRMVQATISAEDRRFERHPGVDPLAVARALLHFRSQPSGASTITQQLARRLYLADDAGPLLARKLREALIALQLEAHRSKSEILALYLNDVYYGRGAYGAEAAARAYFGVSARNLDLAHAAYLAGLPQRPSAYEPAAKLRRVALGNGDEVASAAYDPATDDGPARARQAYVLRRMVEDGSISRAEAEAAAAQSIQVLPAAHEPIAHHFVSYALAELAARFPALRADASQNQGLAVRRGLVVETTLDAGLQREAERLVRRNLARLAERNVTNGAVVAIEPGTGRILALVGSAADDDPAHGGQIDMALAPRQPGSALKPLLYAAAFERGATPATPLLDVPTTFATDEGPYAPLNSDRSFQGVVPLRMALASSLNVPAVRTLQALGLDALLEIAHRFGLSTLSATESYGLSLTLGGGEVRLLDLTAAYAALAAGGDLGEPFAVLRVRDGDGRVLYEHPDLRARPVLSPQHAYLLADILSDADARIPTFGPVTPFDLPFPAAVKTGTSTGFRDNWALGFTPDVAVGVWVGNADGSPMVDISGIDGAGPIWRDVMMAAALGRRMSWPARPPGIVEVTVCSPTGLLPGPDCPSPVRELFVAGTEPTARERYYRKGADGQIAIDPPTEARAWARDAGFTLAVGPGSTADDPLRIVAPAPGSVFFIAPELEDQRLLLRAVAAAGVDRVTFEVDGSVVGDAAGSDASLVWPLEPGRHSVRASARLPDGTFATHTSTFEVRSR